MKNLVDCCIYLAVIGVTGFLLGRVLPKSWFSYSCFPYRPFAFEKGGQIYTTLSVRRWKDKFPDMSAMLPAVIPSKRLPQKATAAQLTLMLRETCVAELTHLLLCIAGLRCFWIWSGIGGALIALLNILGNLPYIIIQRYNRPRLARLLATAETKTRRKEANLCVC